MEITSFFDYVDQINHEVQAPLDMKSTMLAYLEPFKFSIIRRYADG